MVIGYICAIWGAWALSQAFLKLVDWLDAIPAADVVEVKHGKWMADTKGMLHCSNCWKIPTNRIVINGSLVYDMTPIRATMHYCPNCGAKMDGGADDAAD